MNSATFKEQIRTGAFDKQFMKLYPEALSEVQKKRYISAIEAFEQSFGVKDIYVCSAPGRTEISGNHTDHQHGEVLAAAIHLDAIAVAGKNETSRVRIVSQGYPQFEVDMQDLQVNPAQYGTTEALVKGVMAGFVSRGYDVTGFDAYITSDVPVGSGLSSSASLEILLGMILSILMCREEDKFSQSKQETTCNDLSQSKQKTTCNDLSKSKQETTCSNLSQSRQDISPIVLAQIGQYAENVYFGKPCGLMDQMACAIGSAVHIDFANPENPGVEQVKLPLAEGGYCLCITDTKGSHADLTPEYAAIVDEMKAVAAFFGKEVLGEVEEKKLLANLPEVREACGDRSVLRALHFYQENVRVRKECAELKEGNLLRFLALVQESGDSSYQYLQNVHVASRPAEQNLAIGIAVSERVLSERGYEREGGIIGAPFEARGHGGGITGAPFEARAYEGGITGAPFEARGHEGGITGAPFAVRVHGGGFAGTIQAFVPNSLCEKYRKEMDAIFGANACRVLYIRPYGAVDICKID